MRCSFRAHVGGISSIDCHPLSGLFISSSRNADAHSTVKLWSVSISDASIRPLFDYSRKHHGSSVFSPPRFPKSIVSHVQLLVNSYEVLNAAFAYCDGSQLHVCDIETHKPIVFKHQSVHLATAQFSSSSASATTISKGQAASASRHLSGTGDALGIPSAVLPAPAPVVAAPPAAAHHFKADGSALIGGISCFDYSPALHALVLGTSSASLRWLDLRSGCGFVSSAWQHHSFSSGNAPMAPALRCVVAGSSSSGGGGIECSQLVYTGLSSGEIVVFDVRTGCALLQWRAHDASILQLQCMINTEGQSIVVASGADHAISVWMITQGASPVLLQRFLHLEENARGMILLRPHGANGITQLSCTVGSRIALVTIQTAELPPGAKRPSTVLPLTPVQGYKGKSIFSCMAQLPLYGLSLIGADDGRIIGAK